MWIVDENDKLASGNELFLEMSCICTQSLSHEQEKKSSIYFLFSFSKKKIIGKHEHTVHKAQGNMLNEKNRMFGYSVVLLHSTHAAKWDVKCELFYKYIFFSIQSKAFSSFSFKSWNLTSPFC